MFFLILALWMFNDYTVVMKTGRIYECEGKYFRTSEGYVQLNLTDGRVLTFAPEYIDFEETARRNGEDQVETRRPIGRPYQGRPLADGTDRTPVKRPVMEIPDDHRPREPVEEVSPEVGFETEFEGFADFFDAWFGKDHPNPLSGRQKGVVLIFLALALMARIWFLTFAFRLGIFWGIGALIVPFVDLVILVRYFGEVWLPFFLNLLFLVIATAGLFIL